MTGNKSIKNQFLDLSIEELMKVEVTSASRRTQKLSEVPSAIFVITQDDIRRSGATSIPEALRMAPGVEVARIGTDKWAISIRGFNGRFADKLQVLMDGRSVYNPLFAGVQWEQQDTLMEDIERIEVIRGPNAAVWGANAVNGIINIITKKAADTQGTLLSAYTVRISGIFVSATSTDSAPFTAEALQSACGFLHRRIEQRFGLRVLPCGGLDPILWRSDSVYPNSSSLGLLDFHRVGQRSPDRFNSFRRLACELDSRREGCFL